MPKRKKPAARSEADVIRERTQSHRLANHYHHGDPVQFTDLRMDTISWEYAESLVDDVCNFEFGALYCTPEQSRLGYDSLVKLIAGIAAYEDHDYRQTCAERAIKRIFGHSPDGECALVGYVAEVYRRDGDGGGDAEV